MLKSIIIATLSVCAVSGGSLEAQLFRRFAAPQAPVQPRQPTSQRGQYLPYGGYSGSQQGYQGQAYQGQAYSRRVQVAPGVYRVVPVEATGVNRQGAPTPQDVARQATQAAKRAVDQPSGSQQTTQPSKMYRRVTVYDPRTGQRSVRLVAVPSNTIAQQPYVYGQNPTTAMTQKQQNQKQPNGGQVVRGTLNPPVDVARQAVASATNQPTSRVEQAGFSDTEIRLDQPNVASTIPAVVLEPQPASRTRAARPIVSSDATEPVQGTDSTSRTLFSVLEFDDDDDSSPEDGNGLELVAPAN